MLQGFCTTIHADHGREEESMHKRTTGLIADIGGTHARFALADGQGIHEIRVLSCADYRGITEAVQDYLDGIGQQADAGYFAVAGPVLGDRVGVPGGRWCFSIEEVRQALGLDMLHVVNDFEAVARSIPYLGPEDVLQIGGGQAQPEAPIGVIGPGTGLGVAGLVWNGKHYRPVPAEGGHVNMPVRTQREFDLLQILQDDQDYVSAEQVCSGPGLENLYRALCRLDGHPESSTLSAEEISGAALRSECGLCEEALDIMAGVLGCVAGNLALTIGAHGGVYIAGGIPGKLGDYFIHSRFREDFMDKGEMRPYVEQIPTMLITHPYPALLGLQKDFIAA